MKTAILTIVLLVSVCVPGIFAQQGDALDEALDLAGLRRADLGWAPKGWWQRWPDAPYKLRAFDSLFAAPLDSITYARALANAMWKLLDPAALDQGRGRSSRNLFHATQLLGIDPKFGGFRGYTANCLAPEMPLDKAILELIDAGNHPTRINTFGMDLLYPRPKKDLEEKVKVLPEGVSPVLGRLVLNMVDAHRWAKMAFRRVDGKARIKVAQRFDVGEEMVDAYDYEPAMDDVAGDLDEASLWYAALKCVQSLDDARVALKSLALKDVPDFSFDWETHWGWIRVRGGGNDTIEGEDALLIVDLGGNDTYKGGAAASTAGRPLGLLLDMEGDDSYQSERPAQGAGLCGVGVLIDASGNDTYRARHYAQGVGQFGFGLCADLGGDDEYFNKFSGQGCGYFGIGLLFDVSGNDQYTLYADGQGLGGVAGVGVLADRSGNDRYLAVREHSVTGRPSYHSPGLDVCVSNAQGCAIGRRGDGADGHSWAGGLGALLDGEGDDSYKAGNWCMGTGYWFGIGILHDGRGDDEYRGVAYSQGCGAHFCIGVHVDEQGNDKHLAEENSFESIAWAHDFTIGILLDGEGNDVYRADKNGLAYSINRSIAMLLDAGGDDVYQTKTVPRPGFTHWDNGFANRDGVNSYFAETTSLALFLDVGGRDTYWKEIKNNTLWLDEKESPNWKRRNFAVGVDREEGKISFR